MGRQSLLGGEHLRACFREDELTQAAVQRIVL